MPWFKVDDAFHGHRKIRALRRAKRHDAIGLWVLCGAWSSANNEDGFVPTDVLVELAGTKKRADSMVEALMGSLFEAASKHGETGIKLHDFEVYNPTGEVRRSTSEAKSAAGKKGAAARWGRDGAMAPAMADANSTAEASANAPVPARPGPSPKKTSSSKRRPETPAPDVFPPTDSMREWITEHGISVDQAKRETSRFLDYHRAKDNRFRDWEAAWRNWMDRVTPDAGRREDTNNVIGMVLDVGMQ